MASGETKSESSKPKLKTYLTIDQVTERFNTIRSEALKQEVLDHVVELQLIEAVAKKVYKKYSLPLPGEKKKEWLEEIIAFLDRPLNKQPISEENNRKKHEAIGRCIKRETKKGDDKWIEIVKDKWLAIHRDDAKIKPKFPHGRTTFVNELAKLLGVSKPIAGKNKAGNLSETNAAAQSSSESEEETTSEKFGETLNKPAQVESNDEIEQIPKTFVADHVVERQLIEKALEFDDASEIRKEIFYYFDTKLNMQVLTKEENEEKHKEIARLLEGKQHLQDFKWIDMVKAKWNELQIIFSAINPKFGNKLTEILELKSAKNHAVAKSNSSNNTSAENRKNES